MYELYAINYIFKTKMFSIQNREFGLMNEMTLNFIPTIMTDLHFSFYTRFIFRWHFRLMRSVRSINNTSNRASQIKNIVQTYQPASMEII